MWWIRDDQHGDGRRFGKRLRRGTANVGAASGSTAAGGVGSAILPECPGATPVSAISQRCRTNADCPGGERCSDPAAPQCSGLPPAGCQSDPDCESGQICVRSSDPCGGLECSPQCNATSCASGEQCGTDGHCHAVACSAGYQCPSGSQCNSGIGADAHGCNVQRCNNGGTCPANYQCEPNGTTSDGCVARSCASDKDCDCGACEMGQCARELFVCVQSVL